MPHRVETSPGLREDAPYSSQGPMAQTQTPPIREPISPPDVNNHSQQQSLWRRIIFGRDKDHGSPASSDIPSKGPNSEQDDPKSGIIRRVSRKVVPGLPRAPTFKRQQSELRDKLEPVQQTPAERRAVSMDRRIHASATPSIATQSNPRTSAPDFLHHTISATASVPSLPINHVDEKMLSSIGDLDDIRPEWQVPHDMADAISLTDAHSMSTSQYDNMIHDELERVWILNLSMHFRDKSKREKFFVTYRENESLWRRVTISLDYRNAPENSLEMELVHTKFQRDKSAKIYEAIRESLSDIQFYHTVTNLKLQTTDGRLHVHVVEDVNEIIPYPTARMISHMSCPRIKESQIQFDSHLSGFVYKVRVGSSTLIKKEIPGPDTVDEFLYEINALNRLRFAKNVIQFYGVIVDDNEEHVKGLLISYAEQGALIDVLYDGEHSIPWNIREKWARQIVAGLAEIHESGFVQGDFTLSNIVVNEDGDAKIIDINRRGCPVGWEPPEATPLIESNQRISMYIGVKSDLFQLGMVLWALATQEDEPEVHGRPLRIGEGVKVPGWYRRIVEICLSEDPRRRIQALHLMSLFPEEEEESEYGGLRGEETEFTGSGEFGGSPIPQIKTVQPPSDWAYVGWGGGSRFAAGEEPYSYPTRGRSPPSPMPSHHGRYGAMRYAGDWDDDRGGGASAIAAPSVSEAGEGYGGVVSKAGDELEESVSTPIPAKGGDVGVEIEGEQPGQSQAGDEPTPDFSTPQFLAERPEEKISLDVSEKPKTDGDETGKTEPDMMVMAQAATEEKERESSSATPHVRVNVGTVAESLSIERPPSDATPMTDNADTNATRTSPRQTLPQVRVPDALTGIGSAHSFELDSLGGNLIPDDEFGIANFAKGLDVTGTTMTMTTDMGTTDTDTSLVTGNTTTDAIAIDDNETKDKHKLSNNANITIDTEMK